VTNEDLRTAAPGPEPGGPSTPPSRAWVKVVLAAVVLAMVGAGVGTAYGLARDDQDDPATRADPTPTVTITGSSSEPTPSECSSGCPSAGPTQGARTVSVPHVVGHNEADARQAVRDRGLNPQVRYACSSSGTVGAVTAQSPQGNSQVKVGNNVSLDVRGATVPDVMGQYHGDARHALEEAGFTVEINNRQPGTAGGGVTGQNPGAHACVKHGSSVKITVGRDPDPSTTQA
jgi:serine/threonine-protein kinase